MRVSEALRLGDNPPPPRDAMTVAPDSMTWVLGASTGDFTTPYSIYRPSRTRLLTSSSPAVPASPSWSHPHVTPTSPQAVAVYVAGASSQNNPVVDAVAASSRHTIAPSPRRLGSGKCEETRAKVLHDDPINVVALLMMRESAGHVILLLEQREEETRVRLLTVVNRQIHRIMESPNGSDVFGALLRSCTGRPDDLQGVVQAFAERNDAVWRRWIMRRAADSDDICKQWKIWHQSQFGCKFLEECFRHAKGDDLAGLEISVLNHAKKMAMGQYSNYLLQHAIKCGIDEFLCSLFDSFLHLPEADLVDLVTGRFSSFAIRTLLDTGRMRLPALTLTRMLRENISMLPSNVLNHPNGRPVVNP
ncbi:hypothetical protein ACQ4PT_000003 [Festuca glaucescens]